MTKAQTILAIVNMVGFIIITILVLMASKFGVEWAKQIAENILPLIVGCWITNATTVINYVFGSSQTSANKNAVIEKLVADKVLPT